MSNPKSTGMFSRSINLIIYRLLAVFVSYAFTWLVARYYGASVVGLFALMNVVILVGVLLSKSGLDTLFLRDVSAAHTNGDHQTMQHVYSRTLGVQLLTGFVISMLLFVFSDRIASRWFDNEALIPILKYAAMVILPLTFTTVHAEGMRGTKRLFWYLSLTRIWHFSLAAIAILVLHLFSVSDSIYFFWAYFAAIGLTSVFGFMIWTGSTQLRPRPSFDSKGMKEALKQSWPMMLSSSMFLVMSWTDTFMLGIFEDTEQVGFYHVAVKVSNMVAIVLFGINGIAAPKMAASWANKNKETLSKVISGASTLSFSLSLPIVLGIIFFRSELLELFGTGMTAASTALIFLACGQFINGSCGSVMNILQMTHHQKVGQNILLSAGLLNMILNYVLIPNHGIEGAAIATSVSTAYWNLLSVAVVRWKIGHWSLPFTGGIHSLLDLIRKN